MSLYLLLKENVTYIGMAIAALLLPAVVMFAQITPPSNIPPQQGTVPCPLYPTAGPDVMRGFGVWYDLFTASANLTMTADCSTSGATLKLLMNNRGQYQRRLNYKIGYIHKNDTWLQINFRPVSNNVSLINDTWYEGDVQAEVPLTAQQLTGPTYFVGYQCTAIDGQWKCGCSSPTCNPFANPKTGGLWQVQAVSLPSSTPTPTPTPTPSPTVSPASIRVVSPNGGEMLAIGQPYTIKWSAPSSLSTVYISLGIPVSNGEFLYFPITNNIPNTGSYVWTPTTKGINVLDPLTPGSYMIKITGGSINDVSDASFNFVIPTLAVPGAIWRVEITEPGWTATWTRRQNSSVFDAKY